MDLIFKYYTLITIMITNFIFIKKKQQQQQEFCYLW